MARRALFRTLTWFRLHSTHTARSGAIVVSVLDLPQCLQL